MQRLQQYDRVGHLLAKDEWEVVSISAIELEERAYQPSDDSADFQIRRPSEVLL